MDAGAGTPSQKLFVGNLSWQTTDESLRQAFAAFGDVESARVILDRETGRSRGFGFVGFTTVEAATAAQAKMHNADLDGRQVRVNFAQESSGGGGGGGGFRGGRGGGRGGRGGY